MDRWNERVELADRALTLARSTGNRRWELWTLVEMLTPLYRLGRWDDAIAAGEEAKANDEIRLVPHCALPLAGLVAVHLGRGDVDRAAAVLEEIPEPEQEREDASGRAMHVQARAQLLMAQGRPGEALATVDAALATLRDELGLTNAEFKEVLVTALEAAFAVGDLEKLAQLISIVHSAAPGEVTPWLRAQAARLSAHVEAARGQHDVVRGDFAIAEGGFRHLGAVFDLAVTELEHAEWLSKQGRNDEAEPLLGAAATTFDRLAARPWLERVRRVHLK